MGCVSSTFLDDDDRRIIGVSVSSAGHHIVSLTSSTYGILTTLEPTHPAAAASQESPTPPPPPPPPPPPQYSTKGLVAAELEVINSWELMAGLLDPATPAKNSPRARKPPPYPAVKEGGHRRPVRQPLSPIDSNAAAARALERRFPPGGANAAVLYTTTLRGVRATFEACNAARAALESHGVCFRERDVSMDRGFREELRELLRGTDAERAGGGLAVPRLFVRGRHVGGTEEVLRLHEEGALSALLEGLPRARGTGVCDGCGGMRFLPCFECSGSRKVAVAVEKGKGKGKAVVVRCVECNENGLVLCPICS